MPRQTVFFGALLLAACSSPTEAKKPVKTPVVSVKPEASNVSTDKPQTVRAKRELNESPNGDVATIVIPGNRVEILDKTKSSRTLNPDTLHPPAGERGLIGISPQTTTFLDDGSLLVGVGDGTLVLLDMHDLPKWSIGFRGAVTGIVPADDNRVIITTQRGVVASVNTKNGQIIWEKHLVSGALTRAVIGADDHIYVANPRGVLAFSEDGSLVFSHAVNLTDDICCKTDPKEAFRVDASGHITAKGLDIRVSDMHPPIADTTPTYVVDYERILDEKIFAVVSTGPDELWLNVTDEKKEELLRYAGGKLQRFLIPSKGAKLDRRSEEDKPEKPVLVIDDVVWGPTGNPWVLARAHFSPSEGEFGMWRRPAKAMILELTGATVRERNDLATTFKEHWVDTYEGSRIRAADNGTARIFCFGNDEHVCALYNGGQHEIISRKNQTASISVIGKYTYLVSEEGKVERLDGRQLSPVPVPPEATSSITAVGGVDENDLWFTTEGYVAYHWNGKTFVTTSAPDSMASGVIANSSTDVWSRNGRMHWDGKRWAIVADAQGAAGIVVRGPDNVWVGNRRGLFHGKPTKRTLVRVPDAKSVDTKPLETPKSVTLGATQAGYTIAKTSLVVKGGAPISTAKRVEVARDGTLWIEAWDRLVEVDAEGKTTVIDSQEKRIAFDRWFYPEGPGRGLFSHRARESEDYNGRDELRRFEGGKSVESNLRLDGHDIVAISGNTSGVTWILGSVEAGVPYQLQKTSAEELGIHALVRTDEKSAFQIVAGLPAVAYRDVAVTPDGGGFFVGSLNAGPMGEGFIVHARGRLGTESVTRYRAPATIFAVAAISNDEAWAVGAMGLIVHIKGNAIERQVLPSGAWLRAVIANGPNDVWLGGDDGTLIHYDGQAFHPVTQPLGPRAAFSGLGFARGVVWATSPSGILRIVK